MFIKPNPKGMALILHTLICIFDDKNFRPVFSVCWFPYTIIELKEFKQLALTVCLEQLVQEGMLPPGLFTKAIIETASGVRLW